MFFYGGISVKSSKNPFQYLNLIEMGYPKKTWIINDHICHKMTI